MKLVGKILLGLLALIGFMVVRTFMVMPAGEATMMKESVIPEQKIARIANNLSQAITYRTISWSADQAPDIYAFNGFHDFLRRTYPAVHQAMDLEKVSEFSLMYRWPAGKRSDKKPIAFAAHMDVVPVPEFGLADWTHPPFDGKIDENGILWGRGALDDKGMLITLLEGAENLITEGFQPDRDIYFLFGHDEELGGTNGALVMAEILKSRNVQLEWVMDEGSFVVQGAIPGVESPVALISLGEKGFLTLRFSAEDEGGHSSAPKAYTAASLAARAGYLVMEDPHPLVLDENLEQFMRVVAPEMNFASRFIMANLWATRPLLVAGLANTPTTAAFMGTTTAFTMMSAGTKSNILPQYGEAVVNYRIHPRDTVEGVMARAKEIIADPRIKITPEQAQEASRMSSVDGEGFGLIAATVAEIFGDIPIAPSMTLAGTDGKHYYSVANDVYRFTAILFKASELKGIHGTNESIDIKNLARQVVFYEALITKAAQ